MDRVSDSAGGWEELAADAAVAQQCPCLRFQAGERGVLLRSLPARLVMCACSFLCACMCLCCVVVCVHVYLYVYVYFLCMCMRCAIWDALFNCLTGQGRIETRQRAAILLCIGANGYAVVLLRWVGARSALICDPFRRIS